MQISDDVVTVVFITTTNIRHCSLGRSTVVRRCRRRGGRLDLGTTTAAPATTARRLAFLIICADIYSAATTASVIASTTIRASSGAVTGTICLLSLISLVRLRPTVVWIARRCSAFTSSDNTVANSGEEIKPTPTTHIVVTVPAIVPDRSHCSIVQRCSVVAAGSDVSLRRGVQR